MLDSTLHLFHPKRDPNSPQSIMKSEFLDVIQRVRLLHIFVALASAPDCELHGCDLPFLRAFLTELVLLESLSLVSLESLSGFFPCA